MTECGLPGIREIPYGVHMCQFFRTREELAAALVPYFAAGLQARERCIWVTADPLRALAAKDELAKSGFDVDDAIGRGALVIRDHDDWYASAGELKGNQVVDLWLAEEQRALRDGYAGLRITGNITFLRPDEWDGFMEYEALVNRALHGTRIVTLCTYHLHSCGASEVLDVMRRHDCTLERPDHGWQILTST
jgi:hypothetical protein